MKNQFSLSLLTFCALLGWAEDCDAQQRIIKLPEGWNHARLAIYDSPTPHVRLPAVLKFPWTGESTEIARGSIAAPKDAFVGVIIDAVDGYEDFISKMPNDGIQRLELLNADLTTETLKHIEQIKSLRQIWLKKCNLSRVDASLLNGLPHLQHLFSIQSDTSAQSHTPLAAWAAKSPQLQSFHDGEDLSLEEIRRFGSHTAPLNLPVAFAEDAVAVIEALGDIPNLVGLTVRVSDNVPENFHQSLEKLNQLSSVNWGGGEVDDKFLKSVAKIPALSTLRFQGNAHVSDSFVEQLSVLKDLNAISFGFRLSDYQTQILPSVLLSMKNLREVPELVDVSSEQLRNLSARNTIDTLSIAGLKVDATLEQVAQVIQCNQGLTSLSLRGMELTPGIANAIGNCKDLTDLKLEVKDFDGRLLLNADQLQSLTSLDLGVRGRAVDLAILGQLPKLTTLYISLTTFDTNHWSFIEHAPALRLLEIRGGYCDDSVVKWIKRSKTLQSFSTRQSSLLSDQGVAELSQCTQLESLTIEGFITKNAMRKLRTMPNLRRLSVSTDLLDENTKQSLASLFSHLDSLSLGELNPLAGKITAGADQIYRQTPAGGRDDLDAMEGVSLEDLMGEFLTDKIRKRLAGKTVLIEFWGTWCGPCLSFKPELERLHEKYRADGFEVMAIHTQQGSEAAAQYLETHPKPWLNLVDADRKLQDSFSVHRFPSMYIFGTDGKMRIAVPYRQTLDKSLELLLKNPKGL